MTHKCIQCKHHVLGTAESHECKRDYHQDNSVYTGQCKTEEDHGCKDWGAKCELFKPLKEDAMPTDTQTTIAECEDMLRALEGRVDKEEEASPSAPTQPSGTTATGTRINQGTYLQGQNDRSYVYCFCPLGFKGASPHYLNNIITGGRWDATGDIVDDGSSWVLKASSSLKVITPARAVELIKAAHKLG